MHAADSMLNELFAQGGALEIAVDGSARMHATAAGQVLLPGAFNPVHDGHRKLAQTSRDVLQRQVAFELSLANADKPDLSWAEVRRRIGQFHNKASVWLTRAPTFVQKAVLFPQSIFVVGADTAARILQERFYPPGQDSVAQALSSLRERGCRFLVGCRLDAGQHIIRAADLPIPAGFADLFSEIAPENFRVDLSSTELRRRDIS